MRKRFLALLMAAVAAQLGCAAFAAQAQEEWYVSLQGGGGFLSDAALAGAGVELDFAPGFTIAGSAGIALPNNLRFEVEVSYARNDIDRFSGFGVSVEGGGDVGSLAYMGNGFYDNELGPPWTLYVGGGAGLAIISINDPKIIVPGVGTIVGADDEDAIFAYQLGAGIAYEISDSTDLTLGYRFFATADPDFNNLKTVYMRHDARLGLRFRFGPGR